jgi:hypothetical protein
LIPSSSYGEQRREKAAQRRRAEKAAAKSSARRRKKARRESARRRAARDASERSGAARVPYRDIIDISFHIDDTFIFISFRPLILMPLFSIIFIFYDIHYLFSFS